MFNWIGFAFVDEDIENSSQLENIIADKIESLREIAQENFETWLNEQGLTMEMGVVTKK